MTNKPALRRAQSLLFPVPPNRRAKLRGLALSLAVGLTGVALGMWGFGLVAVALAIELAVMLVIPSRANPGAMEHAAELGIIDE